MRPHFIFCFLCCWCFGAIQVHAQEKKGTIKGRLVFEQNWSMQYEALNLLLPQQKIITSTDSIGNFVLAEQPLLLPENITVKQVHSTLSCTCLNSTCVPWALPPGLARYKAKPALLFFLCVAADLAHF